MIRGVRRPEEVNGLGLSNRLLVRIGALLKKNIAISRTLLESAPPGSPMEGLLLEPALLAKAAELDAATLNHFAQLREETKGAQLALGPVVENMRAICLQEELDAGEGWGAGAAAEATPSTALAPVQTTLARTETAQGSNSSTESGLFSRSEIERWRLKLTTSGDSSERMEALRTLALAPLTPPEKLDALLQGLSDREAAVRAEAAGLLIGVGADKDVAEALAGLNNADPARRIAAADRLLVLIKPTQSELEIGSVAMCALCMLKLQFDSGLTGRLLDLLRACAPAVGRNPERLAEVVRIVAGLIAKGSNENETAAKIESLLNPAHRLMNAFGAVVPQLLFPVLHAELSRCSDLVTEAFLLQSLLDLPPAGDEEEQKLLQKCVNCIGRDMEEGRDSRALGVRMVRRGERALLAMCEGFATAHMGAQKYFLILFDDICRLSKVSPAELERAAKVVLHCIETGSKGLRMSAMECRFITDMEISEETRKALAKSILDCVDDFIFKTDIEKIEATLSRLGLPAVDPLLERIALERSPEERIRAVRLLGDWSLNVKAPRGQIARLQQSVTDVLRKLQALSFEEKFPDRGELLCALGKLVSSPAASKDADAIITRTLLDAARGDDTKLVPRALEGLTYVAASRRAQADMIHATSELLRHVLNEMVLDIGTDTKNVDGETVIEIKGGEKYTSFLPILLKGMSRVACSSSCPPAIMKDLGLELLSRWKKICKGELIWGPANAMLLVQALKELGCHKAFPPELRLEILKSFAPKHVQAPIMHAISDILAADDSQTTAVGAVTLGYAILGRRGKDGQFGAEDRADILRALSKIAGRKVLGGIGPEAQQKAASFRTIVVEELFKGLKDALGGCYEALVVLRENPNAPKELRDTIERRLKEYQSLAVQ
jgi:hypothetical protein